MSVAANSDPYCVDAAGVLEPPTGFGEIVLKSGPGIVLAASNVGSGELNPGWSLDHLLGLG